MPKRTEEHAVLIAQTGSLKGQRFVLDRALVIGREASCDVTIPDRQVSRYLASCQQPAGGWSGWPGGPPQLWALRILLGRIRTVSGLLL